MKVLGTSREVLKGQLLNLDDNQVTAFRERAKTARNEQELKTMMASLTRDPEVLLNYSKQVKAAFMQVFADFPALKQMQQAAVADLLQKANAIYYEKKRKAALAAARAAWCEGNCNAQFWIDQQECVDNSLPTLAGVLISIPAGPWVVLAEYAIAAWSYQVCLNKTFDKAGRCNDACAQ